MNFPRYWARGRSGDFTAWRWSDVSYEDALRSANEAAAQLRARFMENRPPQRYGYADRPLREPVLHEMRDAAGNVSAVVTRNSYGCHVLNTANAMFVDIDFDDENSQHPAAQALARAGQWAQSQPGWSWRAYRTRAGLRLLATHSLFDSRDPVCQTVFQAVNADPLYRRLCSNQQCFRARLTPKPWRVNLGTPQSNWPFLHPAAENEFKNWEASYWKASNPYATCQLLPPIGTGQVTSELHPIIELHDNVSRATSGLPLA